MSKQLLSVAGILSFAVAIFQAGISFSPSRSIYFGAPKELAANKQMLIIGGLAFAVIFAIFGLYALPGAGHVRPLPWLWLGLLGFGGVYTLRGLFVIPLIFIMAVMYQISESIPPTALPSSLVSLFIGVLYLAGTIYGWRDLPTRTNS